VRFDTELIKIGLESMIENCFSFSHRAFVLRTN